ncbi:MAG TPA: DUF1127 domain-containing protein [Verrucomicrobiae bacterium]|nr:DUF1127 domain-containing protein [Verrucomicrobiae bacterium]
MQIKNLHLNIPNGPIPNDPRDRPSRIEQWRRAISAAIASFRDYATEGFALHVTSLHPEIFWTHRDGDDRDFKQSQFEQPQWRQAVMRPSFERDDPTALMSMGTVPPWGSSRWSAGLFSLPARLWSKLVEAQEQRRATAALEALDDRTLKDMGLSRNEIHHAVKHGRPGN